MRINDDHLYHGAALTQIAEYPTFKAINAFEPKKGEKSRSAFTVNHDTGVYLKYGTSPNGIGEYVFMFNKANIEELAALQRQYGERVFIVLVCRAAKEICVVTLPEFENNRAQPQRAKGSPESTYTLLATVPSGKEFPGVHEFSGEQGQAAEARISCEPQSIPTDHFQRIGASSDGWQALKLCLWRAAPEPA
jgi:hypothetical protein